MYHFEGPRWVSVGLGIIICETCAEIHKILGVQSKMKDLFGNEPWDAGTLEFLGMMGNKRANDIWEFQVFKFLEISWNFKIGFQVFEVKN